jgi:excisionase family DNA binding protein
MPAVLTTAEVAEIFRVHPNTVWGWRLAGKLPAFRTPGRGIRFRREHVEALLNATIAR